MPLPISFGSKLAEFGAVAGCDVQATRFLKVVRSGTFVHSAFWSERAGRGVPNRTSCKNEAATRQHFPQSMLRSQEDGKWRERTLSRAPVKRQPHINEWRPLFAGACGLSFSVVACLRKMISLRIGFRDGDKLSL